jgi:hypothetical protein
MEIKGGAPHVCGEMFQGGVSAGMEKRGLRHGIEALKTENGDLRQSLADSQAEVERRNIVIIGLVELVTVVASTLEKKGYHEVADMIGRYLDKYCPHWQPKEGGQDGQF